MDDKKTISPFLYNEDIYGKKAKTNNNKSTVDDDKSSIPSEIQTKEDSDKTTENSTNVALEKIQKLLETANSIGITDFKGSFDNTTIEIQGPNTIIVLRNPTESPTSSQFSYHNKEELNAECRRLHSEGYTQVQIAKELKISQSRVSQILKEK
ncbi:sigma factor-like helix-turn-helix DNA-binding protein [uncultured Megasphaera sp.]|uniref:sigma factor-like helix-turn-helix DNA-binding protein n=1 Tax=uncultured Megasphaera sp. TaxID=165188 RepID=UPI0026310762|nr:sigma factor-like helix-turn-helix DNA-binding protein [uncultured Megasphaera sp.]